jgi:hypothetical protein
VNSTRVKDDLLDVEVKIAFPATPQLTSQTASSAQQIVRASPLMTSMLCATRLRDECVHLPDDADVITLMAAAHNAEFTRHHRSCAPARTVTVRH